MAALIAEPVFQLTCYSKSNRGFSHEWRIVHGYINTGGEGSSLLGVAW